MVKYKTGDALKQGIALLNENKIENYVVEYMPFMMSLDRSSKKRRRIKTRLMPWYRIKLPFVNFFAIKQIEAKINMKEIDVIHTNINRVNIGSKLSKKYKIPHILHLREFGDLDYSCFFLDKKYIKKFNKNPYNRFVAISEIVQKEWLSKGLDPARTYVIYNGVNTDNIEYNEEEREDDLIKIVFAGSLCKTKGQNQFIEALGKLDPDVQKKISVDIYGDATKEYVNSSLKPIITKNKLEKIINLKGYSNDLYKLYKDYDIGINCSKSEGFGRVTAEYMAAGLCTIASDTGANPELVSDRVTGLIYKYGDTKDLAEKLLEVINNKELLNNIKKEARKKAISDFTIKRNAKQIYELYLDMINNK